MTKQTADSGCCSRAVDRRRSGECGYLRRSSVRGASGVSEPLLHKGDQRRSMAGTRMSKQPTDIATSLLMAGGRALLALAVLAVRWRRRWLKLGYMGRV